MLFRSMPEMILAGRKLNDNMGSHIVQQVLNLMRDKNIVIEQSKVLIMGLSFKENCPDLRNTKVIDLIKSLKAYKCNVDVYDPWVDQNKAKQEYNIELVKTLITGVYDGIILAVAHNEFKAFTASEIRALGKESHILFDVKHLLQLDEVDGRL